MENIPRECIAAYVKALEAAGREQQSRIYLGEGIWWNPSEAYRRSQRGRSTS